jgi:hypothetical protein
MEVIKKEFFSNLKKMVDAAFWASKHFFEKEEQVKGEVFYFCKMRNLEL